MNKSLIVGNWKMNCGLEEARTLAKEISEFLKFSFIKREGEFSKFRKTL